MAAGLSAPRAAVPWLATVPRPMPDPPDLTMTEIFPPIEEELGPYRHLFKGKVLNAGAGMRDISPLVEGRALQPGHPGGAAHRHRGATARNSGRRRFFRHDHLQRRPRARRQSRRGAVGVQSRLPDGRSVVPHGAVHAARASRSHRLPALHACRASSGSSPGTGSRSPTAAACTRSTRRWPGSCASGSPPSRASPRPAMRRALYPYLRRKCQTSDEYVHSLASAYRVIGVKA